MTIKQTFEPFESLIIYVGKSIGRLWWQKNECLRHVVNWNRWNESHILDELSLKKCHLPAHKIVFKKASIKTQNVQDKSAA